MIISLKVDADVERVIRELTAKGLWIASVSRAAGQDGAARGGIAQLTVAEHSAHVVPSELDAIPGVASVALPDSLHPRVDAHPPTVTVGDVVIGAGVAPVIVAGPCSVEGEDQILEVARRLHGAGVKLLRGGAFKPRSSPYAFQGHGEPALKWLRRAADRYGMRVVTEPVGEAEVELVAEYADLVQIGSRNMQCFSLLKAVGKTKRPVMLKRSMSATIEEWLLAGEYLLSHGAAGVVFCERGVRGFDPKTRNLLDLGAVAMLAHVHRVPVLVDPSHGVGRRDLVLPLARAAIAAGASGVMVEAHHEPGAALSDGAQALAPEAVGDLARALLAMAGGA
jgi:3-deoxy-7-phosphoheptulonate synthase